MAAFGAPDVPEVKTRSTRASGRDARLGEGRGRRYGAHASAYSSVSTTRMRSRPTPRSRPSSNGRSFALGDEELAVGVADVGGELVAAPGRIDADHRRSGHRTRAEPEAELGHVLQEVADVERPGATAIERERGAVTPTRARARPTSTDRRRRAARYARRRAGDGSSCRRCRRPSRSTMACGYFGAKRCPPSRRIVEPLSIGVSTIATTSRPYSSGRPIRFGNAASFVSAVREVVGDALGDARAEQARRDRDRRGSRGSRGRAPS